MIEKSQFATLPSTARGGLLICGMNWGGAPKESDRGFETESKPWAPLFLHPENYSRGFQSPLLTWFGLWGYTLLYETPTDLDQAIAQSNVFVDQTPRFLQKPKTEQWIHGFTRLAEAVKEMDFSGVLLVSKTVADWAIWLSERNHIPKWNQVVGNLQWDAPRYGRLSLRFGCNDTRHVASVSQPSCGVPHADVQASAKEMHTWIANVLLEHKMKDVPDWLPETSPITF
ncbi:MAG: hypothetical protein AB7L09_14365 [Nitrospira sp.]